MATGGNPAQALATPAPPENARTIAPHNQGISDAMDTITDAAENFWRDSMTNETFAHLGYGTDTEVPSFVDLGADFFNNQTPQNNVTLTDNNTTYTTTIRMSNEWINHTMTDIHLHIKIPAPTVPIGQVAVTVGTAAAPVETTIPNYVQALKNVLGFKEGFPFTLFESITIQDDNGRQTTSLATSQQIMTHYAIGRYTNTLGKRVDGVLTSLRMPGGSHTEKEKKLKDFLLAHSVYTKKGTLEWWTQAPAAGVVANVGAAYVQDITLAGNIELIVPIPFTLLISWCGNLGSSYILPPWAINLRMTLTQMDRWVWMAPYPMNTEFNPLVFNGATYPIAMARPVTKPLTKSQLNTHISQIVSAFDDTSDTQCYLTVDPTTATGRVGFLAAVTQDAWAAHQQVMNELVLRFYWATNTIQPAFVQNTEQFRIVGFEKKFPSSALSQATNAVRGSMPSLSSRAMPQSIDDSSGMGFPKFVWRAMTPENINYYVDKPLPTNQAGIDLTVLHITQNALPSYILLTLNKDDQRTTDVGNGAITFTSKCQNLYDHQTRVYRNLPDTVTQPAAALATTGAAPANAIAGYEKWRRQAVATWFGGHPNPLLGNTKHGFGTSGLKLDVLWQVMMADTTGQTATKSQNFHWRNDMDPDFKILYQLWMCLLMQKKYDFVPFLYDYNSFAKTPVLVLSLNANGGRADGRAPVPIQGAMRISCYYNNLANTEIITPHVYGCYQYIQHFDVNGGVSENQPAINTAMTIISNP